MAINAHTHTLQVIIIVHSYMLVIPTSHKLTLVQRPLKTDQHILIEHSVKAEQCIVIAADCDIGTLINNGVNAQKVSRAEIHRYTKFVFEPNRDSTCYNYYILVATC